jgi:gliding motility-associated lipoprotein GldD
MKKLLFVCLLVWVLGCGGEEERVPRPRAYPKILFPERNYIATTAEYCDFTFQYPDYMVFDRDTSFFREKPPHPCWFNLTMKGLNGTIHCTYTPIHTKEGLLKAIRDAYTLADKHNRKASGNTDYIIHTPNKVHGLLYDIEGDVASSFQFVVTDSFKHVLRGSLYFQARPNEDSLKPAIEFVKRDMMQILNTLKWKN